MSTISTSTGSAQAGIPPSQRRRRISIKEEGAPMESTITTEAEELIIGEGTHRYRVIDQWGRLPEGVRFGTTHGVIEDARGRIFIHNTGPLSMLMFDPDGNYLKGWGEAYSEGAHGMFYNREAAGEFLYLSATSQNFMAK